MHILENPRILVVDDEPAIASALTLIMKLQGMDASSFRNPLDLLNFSTLNAPDVVISDVVMPEMTGVDLARQLVDRFPSCKVILFSGNVDSGYLEAWAEKHQPNVKVITKPIRITALLQEVRQLTVH